MLKALKARNIPIDSVAGTSAGSVIGSRYVSGMNAFDLDKLARSMDEASISDWALPWRSRRLLMDMALRNAFNTTLHNQPIEKSVAANLHHHGTDDRGL